MMLLYSNQNMKYFSFLFCFLTIINLTISLDWCPKDCECKIVNNQNQAICTSIQGILEGNNLPIHSIILSNTNLTKISHLDKLRDLIEIDVSNNHLSDIDHLGRRIKILNLSNNKITSAKLTNIPQHVEHLNLSYNEITYLPLELTIKLKKLKTIELIGNKINCTCETLEVRNWLQSIHVSTNNFIKCSYPVQVKDLPWLQVKQKDLCDKYTNNNHDTSIIDDNDNELMLGDQPANDISDEKESIEELGKDFLPIETKKHKKEIKQIDELIVDDTDDGSGGGSLPIMQRLLSNTDIKSEDNTTESDDGDDNGSGSASGLPFIPTIIYEDVDDDNQTNTTNNDDLITTNEHENDTTPIIAPIEETTTQDIFGTSLGVVQFPDETNDNDITEKQIENDEEVTELPVIPRFNVETYQKPDVTVINEDSGAESSSNESYINEANAGSDENRGTYILLGIILLIVVALILFVAIKRIKSGKSNSNNDIENPKDTELQNMDKKNLGKPIEKNGGGNYEQKPLIGEKTKEDYAKPINGNNNNNRKIIDEPDSKIQEPLLNGIPNESNNNNDVPIKENNPNQDTDNQDKSPRTHSPRYGSYPLPKSPKPDSSPNSTGTDDEVFSPSSPRQGRYSPVYSPETGKVKIKLTETPKPKTPMLVTRSRSNAGDIITIKPTADTVDDNIK